MLKPSRSAIIVWRLDALPLTATKADDLNNFRDALSPNLCEVLGPLFGLENARAKSHAVVRQCAFVQLNLFVTTLRPSDRSVIGKPIMRRRSLRNRKVYTSSFFVSCQSKYNLFAADCARESAAASGLHDIRPKIRRQSYARFAAFLRLSRLRPALDFWR